MFETRAADMSLLAALDSFTKKTEAASFPLSVP